VLTGLVVIAILLVIYILFILLPLFRGAPYVPTHTKNINNLISIIDKEFSLSTFSHAVDLGSGDGRVVIALSRKGLKCDGIEQNKFLYKIARRNVEKNRLENVCTIYNSDFFKTNFSKYDLIILFQTPYIMQRLQNKLVGDVKHGSVVASYCFKLPGRRETIKTGVWYIYKF
jgi:16S rRNA G966 N2-methylase RsmD